MSDAQNLRSYALGATSVTLSSEHEQLNDESAVPMAVMLGLGFGLKTKTFGLCFEALASNPKPYLWP